MDNYMIEAFENIFIAFFRYLNSKGKVFNVVIGMAWAALFIALDLYAPRQYYFSFLYMLPIAFVTWFSGKIYGFIISLACAGFWSVGNTVREDMTAGIWNVTSTFAIFIAVSVMLTKIRQLWERDIDLSRTDPLTGVMNVRALSELVDYEILRFQRENSQFSFAYLDVDNFKFINDHYGHNKGDEVLKSIAAKLIENLRKTDIVARVGGDEFTIFLPSTDHEAVNIVMGKVREQLNDLTRRKNWPISFSIGVVTCSNGMCEFGDIMSHADKMMYEVKNAGKNNIRFGIFAAKDGN